MKHEFQTDLLTESRGNNMDIKVGKMVYHVYKSISGRVINNSEGKISIAVSGCDGFYKDNSENFVPYVNEQ